MFTTIQQYPMTTRFRSTSDGLCDETDLMTSNAQKATTLDAMDNSNMKYKDELMHQDKHPFIFKEPHIRIRLKKGLDTVPVLQAPKGETTADQTLSTTNFELKRRHIIFSSFSARSTGTLHSATQALARNKFERHYSFSAFRADSPSKRNDSQLAHKGSLPIQVCLSASPRLQSTPPCFPSLTLALTLCQCVIVGPSSRPRSLRQPRWTATLPTSAPAACPGCFKAADRAARGRRRPLRRCAGQEQSPLTSRHRPQAAAPPRPLATSGGAARGPGTLARGGVAAPAAGSRRHRSRTHRWPSPRRQPPPAPAVALAVSAASP